MLFVKNIISYTLFAIALILSGCDGNSKEGNLDNYTLDVSNKNLSFTQLSNAGCGIRGVDSLIVVGENRTTYNEIFHIGEERGLRAVIKCKNKNMLDVTANADWSSSNQKIFTVSNQASETSSKGYVIPKSLGNATLTVTYDKYSSTSTVKVNAAELSRIQLNLSRNENTLAKGEHISTVTTAFYKDGSNEIVSSGITISTKDSNIIDIKGNDIIGKNTGEFEITANYNGLSSSLNGTVLPAKIVGIKIIESNLRGFIVSQPRTEKVKANLLLSDGTVLPMPDSTLDNPSILLCKLSSLPTDNTTPFLNDKDCNISSTTFTGQNKLTVEYYNSLKPDGTIDTSQPSFTDKILITSTSDTIKKLRIVLDDDLTKIGMVVGEQYRYHILADLSNGNVTDVTKIVPLNIACTANQIDCSSKILRGGTGYVGPGDGTDDGKGGVIQFVDYIDKNDTENIKQAKLILSSNLDTFQDNTMMDVNVYPNVWSITQLGKYFINNVYPQLSDNQKYQFKTFFSIDKSGNIIFSGYGDALYKKLKLDQLKLFALNEKELVNPIKMNHPADDTINMDKNIDIPTVKETYKSDENKDLITTLCNNSDINQTLTSPSVSKSLSINNTGGRGFSVGLEVSQEFKVGFAVLGSQTTVKTTGGYNQSWSWSDTTTNTFTLSPQSVLMPGHSRAIVLQRIYNSRIGGVASFSLPLNESSCIPYKIEADIQGINAATYACFPLLNNSITTKDKTFNRIFSGDGKINFSGSYLSDGASEQSHSSSVSVYIIQPGEPGYDQIKCSYSSNGKNNLNTSIGDLQTGTVSINSNYFLSDTGVKIPLNDKNLIEMKTYQ